MTDRLSSLSTSLLGVLRRVTGDAQLAYESDPVPLTGGFWAELVTFRLADPPPGWAGPLVARVMPDAATAAKETVFQADIADQGFATPRVLASGGPADGVDGRAFMVMTLADGHPLLAGLDGIGALAKLPSLARRLPGRDDGAGLVRRHAGARHLRPRVHLARAGRPAPGRAPSPAPGHRRGGASTVSTLRQRLRASDRPPRRRGVARVAPRRGVRASARRGSRMGRCRDDRGSRRASLGDRRPRVRGATT